MSEPHAEPPQVPAHHSLARRWPRGFEGDGELTATVQLRGAEDAGRVVILRQYAPVGRIAEVETEWGDLATLADWTDVTLTAPLDPRTEAVELLVVSRSSTTETRGWSLQSGGSPVDGLPPRTPGTVGPRDLTEGTGLDPRELDAESVARLERIGRVWGFLKYHHPDVLSGAVDWDGELFDALLADARGEDAVATWRGRYPAVPCGPCVEPHPDSLGERTFPWIDTVDADTASWLRAVHRGRGSLAGSAFDSRPYRWTVEATYPERRPVDDAGLRMLALFRVHAAMDHLYAYGDLQPGWDARLAADIPAFMAQPADTTAYLQLLHAHAASFRDGHVQYRNDFDAVPPVGSCRLPVVLEYVEDQPAVVASELEDVRPGDVLGVSIGGTVVADEEEGWLAFHPGATLAGKRDSLAQRLTSGPCGPVTATFRRKKRDFEVSAERGQHGEATRSHARPGPALVVEDRIATLVLRRMQPDELDAIMARVVEEADGLVIDVRDYPAEVWRTLPAHLHTEPFLTHRGALEDPSQVGGFHWNAENVPIQPRSPHFGGPVAVLADVRSFSLGEGTVLTLSTAPRVRIFGDTTSGTNGSARRMPVPGTYDLSLTINRIYGVDGTLAQGVGIPPDVRVVPTLRDLRRGQTDPAYAASLDWIRGR